MKLLKMLNLIRNESMKITRSISTWIMAIILIVILVAVGLIIKSQASKPDDPNWKTTLTQQNEQYKMTQAEMKNKNSSVEKGFDRTIKTNEYRIAHDIAPTNVPTLWAYVGSNEILQIGVFLITMFSIIIGGGIVANEFSQGTIKLLLIRPSKRWKILLSKYITVLLYALVMLVVSFIVSFIIAAILFSFKGVGEPYLNYNNGVVTEVNMFAHTFSLYGYACIKLVMMVTFAFAISSLFRSSAMAIGLSVFLLFAGNIIITALIGFKKENIAKYILFANTDLTQYTSGSPLINGMTMQFSITVLIVYFVAFNLISFLGFTKRDVAA
jgi:ABC-2 type transport system permease protein